MNDHFRPYASLTAAAAVGIAMFFTVYSLIPLTWSDQPGASSAFIGTMMTFVIAVQVFAPALVRRYSLRTVMAASLVAMAVGVLVTGLAGTLPTLIAAAVPLGLGFGVMVVAGAQGVALLVPSGQLARALGIYGLVSMLGSALGSPAGVQLTLAFSSTVFGVVAFILLLVASGLALTIPSGVGVIEPDGPGASWSSRVRVIGDALSTAPWFIVVFLLLSIVILSHGLTSLPVTASALGSAAAVIFVVQVGNAIGRGFGGELETRTGALTTSVTGALLLVIGGVTSVLVDNFAVILAAGVMIGLGVGTVQSVTLHAVMLRMTPGRASVLWNLGLDGGLWAGGILWGLLLTAGQVELGALVFAALVAVAGIAVVAQLRSENRARPAVEELR